MTVVVAWYRKQTWEIWCAADSRISFEGAIATDSGPKILPIPVVTYQSETDPPNWTPYNQFNLGFANAGSILSAVSTHALASACTQNLACNK
jgi:hypothetical protein